MAFSLNKMIMKKNSRATLAIRILLLVSFAIPIITPFNFLFVYIVYAGGLLGLITLAPPKDIKKLIMLRLIPAILLYSILVISHANDQSSTVNLSAILLTWTLITLATEKLQDNQESLVLFVNTLPKFILLSITLYIPISVIFSSFLEISNPALDLISGDRLRLLSSNNTGHSVLISLSFVGLVLCYSKISLFSGRARWPAAAFFLLLLILSKSSTSWLLIISSTTIYIIESIKNKIGRLAVLGYLLVTVSAGYAALNLNDLLTFFRSNLQGNDTSIYAGDLTAGRAELNTLLLAGVAKAPLTGLGHGHPTLQTGLKDASGKGANSESGLRLATKYGIPYFAVILFIITLPFRAFSLRNKKIRTLSISISSGLLLMLTANATFEAPHSFEFFFFLSLCLILSSIITQLKLSKNIGQSSFVIHKNLMTARQIK